MKLRRYILYVQLYICTYTHRVPTRATGISRIDGTRQTARMTRSFLRFYCRLIDGNAHESLLLPRFCVVVSVRYVRLYTKVYFTAKILY